MTEHASGSPAPADNPDLSEPGLSPLQLLRGVQDQHFEREGVGMFLMLPDAVSPPAPAPSDARLAESLQSVREEMFPTQRDEDLGCLISTVQAFAVREWRS